jgi:hypothetical protein
MTALQFLTFATALFGALGTALMFFGSHAFEPMEGAVWGGPAVDAFNEKVKARNRTRLLMQRSGLVLLGIAFIFQGISAFAPA